MRCNSILTAALSLAGLTPTAVAFLITPEMIPANRDGVSVATELIVPINLKPECNNCPFPRGSDDLAVMDEHMVVPKGNLDLHFFVVNNQLWANSAPVFPFDVVNEPQRPVLTPVFETSSIHSTNMPVDFALESRKMTKGINDNEVILIDFTVLGLAGEAVKVQSVQLKLIQSQGELYLLDGKLMPFDPTKTEAEMCETARNQRFCEFRASVHETIRQMIEAARTHGSVVKDWVKTHGPGNKSRPCPGAMRPHGDRYGNPHRHGGPHHRGFRPAHWLFVVTKTFIIPAALGVVAGVGVSLIGMVVGRLVVMLWVYLVRGGRRGSLDNVRVIEVQIEEGEKTGLMEVVEEGDAPPAYVDEIVIVEQEKQ